MVKIAATIKAVAKYTGLSIASISKYIFIPLFRVEEEVYTVYMDFTGNLLKDSKYLFVKDGSTAY
ncbi:MAG TPA: hypothetical protein VFD57_02965 [Clostridia bacterium]|nr:hypothetical protein [Clostridia bacterium]